MVSSSTTAGRKADDVRAHRIGELYGIHAVPEQCPPRRHWLVRHAVGAVGVGGLSGLDDPGRRTPDAISSGRCRPSSSRRSAAGHRPSGRPGGGFIGYGGTVGGFAASRTGAPAKKRTGQRPGQAPAETIACAGDRADGGRGLDHGEISPMYISPSPGLVRHGRPQAGGCRCTPCTHGLGRAPDRLLPFGHPGCTGAELTMWPQRRAGLWRQPSVTVDAAASAADDLELVHDEPYVTTVKAVSRWAIPRCPRRGLEGGAGLGRADVRAGNEDNLVFPARGVGAGWPGRPWTRACAVCMKFG